MDTVSAQMEIVFQLLALNCEFRKQLIPIDVPDAVRESAILAALSIPRAARKVFFGAAASITEQNPWYYQR